MGTERRNTLVAAAFTTAALVALIPAPASAGGTSDDGWAHRSTETVAQDGWATRTQTPAGRDGFEHAAVELPGPQPIQDGFEVATVELPQPQAVKDGFEVATVELPQPQAIQDGFEVATVELPRTDVVLDGWAAASATETAPASGIDGWSYASVTDDAPVSIARTEPVAPPRSSTSAAELVGLAAAGASAGAIMAGFMFMLYRRHHQPI